MTGFEPGPIGTGNDPTTNSTIATTPRYILQ